MYVECVNVAYEKEHFAFFLPGFLIQIWQLREKIVLLHRVSPTRPAPSELPQGLTAARVGGCSGAM